MCSARLDRGTISPAPLAEVGQADAYVKQVQVKSLSLYSETAKVFLGLWFKGGGGVAWGFLYFVPPQEGDKSTKMQRA